jgi:outer membrane protein OmpA-like peptidoglycan-associated protein
MRDARPQQRPAHPRAARSVPRLPSGRAPASASTKADLQAPSCACGGGCPRCQKRIPLQAKLAVNKPRDALEREADRIAGQITHDSPAHDADSAASEHAGESAVPAHVADYVTASRGTGRGLPGDTRGFFESRLGRDLGGVRVHDDAAAAGAAEAIGARAFTSGQDVYFARGEYGPQGAAGRNLLAHELVHTLQQSRGARQASVSGGNAGPRPAAPAVIQRAPGKSPATTERTWATEHPDVGDKEVLSFTDLYILWNFGIGESKLKGAHKKFLLPAAKTWPAHFKSFPAEVEIRGRASGSGQEEQNLDLSCQRNSSVIQFLQDNGLPGKYITDTACYGSTKPLPFTEANPADTPAVAGAKMAFNRSVEIRIRYLYVIEHESGSRHPVPGMPAGETEFGASGPSSSLLAPAKRRAGRPIGGGFKTDLDVDIGFATGVETAADPEIETMIKSAGKRIDPALLPALRHVARDRFVLGALKSFLEKDKGKIEALESGGHYDGDHSPPTLSIGTSEGDVETNKTMVHELLHYVFDKSDSVVGEAKDNAGADHPAVEAIEARFLIVDLIRSGQPPLHKKLDSAFGEFLKGDDMFPKMQEAIAKDDRKGLAALVAKPEFMKQTVSSGLLYPAARLTTKTGGDEYDYTAKQFRDLAFIHAQNAAIVRHAMKTASAIAGRTNTPLKSVFASAEFQKEMNAFLAAFVKGLRKNRTQGVTSLEASL